MKTQTFFAFHRYLIDQKGITGRWEKALEVAGTTTFATITNLVYGDEYQFRVTPVNHVGKAEASAPSAKVVIKPRFCELRSFKIAVFLR